MEIRTDQRRLEARQCPEARRRLPEGLRRLRELQLGLARDLAEIDAAAHFVLEGCASAVELAVRLGFGPGEARTLLDLGRGVVASPDLEARVRDGRIAVEAAAVAGRILCAPGLVRPGEDWLTRAEREPLRALRKRVRARLEEGRQARPGLVEVSVFVRERTREDFWRCRRIASRREGRTLSDGQAFRRVVEHYLAAFDPLRRKEGRRRVGDTARRPRSRYVPAVVRLAIRRRAGDACEVPGCGHDTHLELAHVRRHAEGSPREERDLVLLCTRHHTLLDAGLLRVAGWNPDGRPVFENGRGRPLGSEEPGVDGGPNPPPPDRVGEPVPLYGAGPVPFSAGFG